MDLIHILRATAAACARPHEPSTASGTLSTILITAAITLLAPPGDCGRPRAQEIEIILEQGLNGYQGTADNTIYEESTNTNGGGQNIFAGKTQGLLGAMSRRALIRFDLAQVPSGSTINSVELRLTVARTQDTAPSAQNLHRLTKDWGEGTADTPSNEGRGTAPVQGDATWVSNFHGISTWDSPGGDFVSGSSASTSVGPIGSTAVWSGSGLVSDAQGWVDEPASNFGWILIGDEVSTQSVRSFHSSEATGQRPRLVVNYTAPQQVTPTPTGTPTATPPPPTPTPPGPTATPTPLVGDLNGDGTVDAHDLYLFMRGWQEGRNP